MLRPHVRERLSVDFAAVALLARFADLVLGEAKTLAEATKEPGNLLKYL